MIDMGWAKKGAVQPLLDGFNCSAAEEKPCLAQTCHWHVISTVADDVVLPGHQVDAVVVPKHLT